MSNPYIYIVKNKQNGKFYIGSQCSGKIIGVNYFTSSTNKEFKEDFKNNTNNYDIWKIASFDNYEECIREENKLIKENFENSLILNKGYILGEHPLTRTKYNTESERKQARKNSVNKYNRNNKEKSKQYREIHKEEIKEKSKQYRETHKEEIKEKDKSKYLLKKEMISAYQKQYRETHKEEIREKKKKYRETHKEKIREKNKKYYYNNINKILEYREINKEEIREKSKQYRETHKEELKVKNKQYNEINKKEISLRVKIVNMIKKDKESYDKYSKLPFSEKKKFREEYYIKVKSKG